MPSSRVAHAGAPQRMVKYMSSEHRSVGQQRYRQAEQGPFSCLGLAKGLRSSTTPDRCGSVHVSISSAEFESIRKIRLVRVVDRAMIVARLL